MSSFSLESGEIESVESVPTNNFAEERGGAKFGRKQFGVNEVIVATVSMSMEQSEELRYVTPNIDNNGIGSNVGSTRMLTMSRRKTRKITTTAATFKSGNSPFSDIGIKVVFGEQPIGMVVEKPELPSGAGKKACRKRRTSARKNNSKVQPSKKNDSIERFSANENEIDNDGNEKPKNMLNYLCVPRKKLVRKPNCSSKNTKSSKESKSFLKTKPIKKSASKETRKPIKRKLNQTSSAEEIEKTFDSPLISSGMAVESPLTENTTNNLSICQNGENCGKIRDLCQFYIQHQCLKGNNCDHMHEDFPCKYYYLGLKCNDDKNTCKLSHGGPLATDVLDALEHHIVSDPVELVGKHFVEEVRCNKTPQELVSLLHEFQAQLRAATQTGGVEVLTTKQCSTDDKLVMRQKLYFLTEEQIKGLEAFNVCHIEQALQLTLWQLNSIGINKATQLQAIMGVVLNEQDVEMRELSQPLKSSTTEHLPVPGEGESNAVEDHDVQPRIIDKKAALDAVKKNCISKNDIKVTCVEPLQRICKTIAENELHSATKRIAQRLQEVIASKAERAQKRKMLILIMDQLNILGDHDKILRNNTTKQTRPPTSNDTSKGGAGMRKRDDTEEAPDNSERNNLSDYIKDHLEIKLETNVVPFSDMKESNVNTSEDANIEVGKIIEKPLEAEISINKKIACTTLEKTDEKENPKSSSEADEVVKMILRSQSKTIQSKNTKSISIDQNEVEGENETPKKWISPCSIKPRRLKLPKREIKTEHDNSKKTISDITSITDIKPINRDEHVVSPHTQSNTLISSNVTEIASEPISNSEDTDDWEDCIAETSKQDASTVIISPFKKSTLKNVNVDNHDVFEDLRYRLDEKKSVFSVKDNFFRNTSSLRDSTSVCGDAMEPKIYVRDNLNKGSYTNKYNQKYSNKPVMRYNRFQRANSNNFNVKERNFSKKYNSESNKYAMEENKPYGYQQNFFDKHSEQNSLNKKRSYEDAYESDEDWDKEESRNNNKYTSSINVNLTEPKDNHTGVPKSPNDEINVENPPSNLNKGNFNNQHSNLKRDEANSGKKPGEMIDCDWDSEFYSPTVLPDPNQIASPTCPSASNFSHYRPPMEINGDRGFSAFSYCLHEIKMPHFEVNKPESLDKLLRSNLVDPRLLKYKDKAYMGSSNVSPMLSHLSPQRMATNDPRRRNNMFHAPITPDGYQLECYIPMHPQNANMLLYNYLQRSPWYQRLMSTMKMQINHTIAELVRALNAFYRDRLIDPTAIFDVFKIDCVGELLEIMRNIGVFIDSNGVIMDTKGLNQCGPRPDTDSSIPINATYSFMPPTTCTSSQPLRNAAGRMLGFMPNVSQPPSCPMPLPNQVQATSFVSCYVDTPPLLPLTARRHSVNANNVMTTPPHTEDDEEAQVPGSDIGYFKNNNYRKFEMGSPRRRHRPAPMGDGSADGRRNRNDSNFNYQRRY